MQTRVVVKADMDVAWIRSGTCRKPSGKSVTLEPFYSFRSLTLVRVPLRSLVSTPHVLYINAGGAHGGDPLGCANLNESSR